MRLALLPCLALLSLGLAPNASAAPAAAPPAPPTSESPSASPAAASPAATPAASEGPSDAVVCGDEADECKEGCTLEFGASTGERNQLGRCLVRCEADKKSCPGKRLEARKLREKKEKGEAERKEKEKAQARDKAKTRPYEPRPAQLPEELRRADSPK